MWVSSLQRLPSHVLLIIISIALSSVQSSGATAASGSNKRVPALYEHDAVSLSRSKLHRWKQRLCHKRLNRRVPLIQKDKANRHRGTSLHLGMDSNCCNEPEQGEHQRQHRRGGPSDDLVSKLFWTSSHVPFNHNMVGITNPCLHIGVRRSRGNSNDEGNGNDNNLNMITVPASVTNKECTSAPAPSVDNCWWPGIACCPDETIREDSCRNCANKDDGYPDTYKYSNWKVLRFRRRVGQNSDCYQRVRDAALQWEFDSENQGMVQVTDSSLSSSSDYSYSNALDHTNSAVEKICYDSFHQTRSDQVMQIWSGPGRRLVTYTAQKWGLLPKPKLYAISPVGVVYDLVDQRGHSTTYTSTAYATLQGHWLRGEERVTVALRDSGQVDVEILSFSRPAKSWQGKLVWPFIGGMQKKFFEQQMKAFERVAKPKLE